MNNIITISKQNLTIFRGSKTVVKRQFLDNMSGNVSFIYYLDCDKKIVLFIRKLSFNWDL